MQPLSRPADAPRKHVIEEYKHKAQTVTCTCGWHGSTAQPPDGKPSDWTAHVNENRGKSF
jgi:hypothetical protein